MKRRLLFSALFLGLLVLAVGGWAVQGARAVANRPRRMRLAPAGH
jgi:hypothetical protein